VQVAGRGLELRLTQERLDPGSALSRSGQERPEVESSVLARRATGNCFGWPLARRAPPRGMAVASLATLVSLPRGYEPAGQRFSSGSPNELIRILRRRPL
jgi:hypothetical protein